MHPEFIMKSMHFAAWMPPQRDIKDVLSDRTSKMESGSDLLFRAVSSQVPSARRGLTSVFGMGTGGSLSPLPPEIGCLFYSRGSLHRGFPLHGVLFHGVPLHALCPAVLPSPCRSSRFPRFHAPRACRLLRFLLYPRIARPSPFPCLTLPAVLFSHLHNCTQRVDLNALAPLLQSFRFLRFLPLPLFASASLRALPFSFSATPLS